MRYAVDPINLQIGHSSGLTGLVKIESRPITREEAIHLLTEVQAVERIRKSDAAEALRSLGVSVRSSRDAHTPFCAGDDAVLVDVLGENSTGQIGFDLYHVEIVEVRSPVVCGETQRTSSFLWPEL